MSRGTITLRLGHSPDPDDVFMWWPLTGKLDPRDHGRVVSPPVLDTGAFRFFAAPADIEALNRGASAGDLEITAISMHTYPHVRRLYALTSCGSSMGDGYGPKVVASPAGAGGHAPADRLAGLASGGATIAVPGTRTTAFLVLSLMLGRPPARHMEMLFSRIVGEVAAGRADAGLVIHEAQLTYREAGLVELADLGAWWKSRTGLPLPLGANAVRRDLDERHGRGTAARVAGLLEASIRHAMANRAESIAYASGFAPGVDPALVDRFVAMYVNDLTLDAGEVGKRAIERLLRAGFQAGLSPDPGDIDLVRPG